jgi:EF-P beta-lysylation protein EpmB
MPPGLVLSSSPPLWRRIQRENFTSLAQLASFLELSDLQRSRLLETPRFPLNVPRRLASKIAKNTLNDPLLRQFVPLAEEAVAGSGNALDPVNDILFRKEKKILHKYKGRALLLTTGACAMHCRYCFRQNFPYETETKGFAEELAYIKAHQDLEEIILSGGDPLSLSDATLDELLQSLEPFSHIRRIRVHSRFPIGIPERIDDSLLAVFARSSKQIVFVIHCNHPKELDPDVLAALRRIAQLGIPLLNQSVLLKGVNDDEDTFLELNRALVNGGIIPYYLHLLDPVEGTSHFRVSEARAQDLISSVREQLSGFGVPRLVREIPGYPSKTFLTD